MSIIWILIFTWLGKFSVHMQDCMTPVPTPCNSVILGARTILVNGIARNEVTPNVTCMMVKSDATIIIYDPITINRVWITVTNTDNACPKTINEKAISIAKQLNVVAPDEVIILNFTPQYFRMVIVQPNGCTSCTATLPIKKFEEQQGLSLYPKYYDVNQFGQFCLNGGRLDHTYTGAGYNCICTLEKAVYLGPACEYMELSITTRNVYLNVFQSATSINIRFLLFSNGIIGNIKLFSIKNANFKVFLDVWIVEASVEIKDITSKKETIVQAIDNQNWHDVSLVVSQTSATLSIGSKSTVLSLNTLSTEDFRAYYLVLNDASINTFKVCIKNLIIDSRIIDLYNYSTFNSCCKDRCDEKCKNYKVCSCNPFQSLDSTKCFCAVGYTDTGKVCITNTTTISQASISMDVVSQLIINPAQPLSKIDFSFQTLSIKGTLATVVLQTPLINVYVQIVNTNLTLNVNNRDIIPLHYNVSNGYIHSVTLSFTLYSIGMMLDNSANYSTVLLNWYNFSTAVSSIMAMSLQLGPMSQPYVSTINNYSTCFSGVQLNSDQLNPVTLNPLTTPNFSPQCSRGPNCSTVNCSHDTKCNDTLWQNTQCVPYCNASYVFNNETCIYKPCINKPCVQGECFYNQSVNNYSCKCNGSCTGYNCDACPSKGPWYIAIIVILLILIIIMIVLLVYFCCCAKAQPVKDPIITKIHETYVAYNDHAGEADYSGPPINFAIMKNALNNGPRPQVNAAFNPAPEFLSYKEEFDKNNEDLILDHPLEYGFEGFDSENESVSSIGSKSGESENDFSEMA